MSDNIPDDRAVGKALVSGNVGRRLRAGGGTRERKEEAGRMQRTGRESAGCGGESSLDGSRQ